MFLYEIDVIIINLQRFPQRNTVFIARFRVNYKIVFSTLEVQMCVKLDVQLSVESKLQPFMPKF